MKILMPAMVRLEAFFNSSKLAFVAPKLKE